MEVHKAENIKNNDGSGMFILFNQLNSWLVEKCVRSFTIQFHINAM